MKKTYMIPEMETVEIEAVGMLAGSLPKTNSGDAITPGMAPSYDFDDDFDEE